MENWERRFDRAHTPDASVPSHRDALRQHLQSEKIPSHRAGRSAATLTVLALVVLGGLTLAYPGWTKDVWNSVIVQTITFRTKDGATVVIKKFPDEACCPAAGDTCRKMVFCETGERRAISFEAGIEKINMPGETGETITISSPDCDQIWIVNGDTIKAENMVHSMEQIRGDADAFNWTSEADETQGEGHVLSGERTAEVGTSFDLGQNYPNPFNPTTQIPFDLKQSGPVTLTVYNLTGQKIATLVDGQTDAGRHVVSFNGETLPSGTYLYMLRAGDHQYSRQMILMK